MTLFQEIDLTTFSGGQITGIEPGSVADEIGLQAGDELLAINENAVEDVIDVQFYSADEVLELLIRREGELLLFEAERDYNQTLGLEFTHPATIYVLFALSCKWHPSSGAPCISKMTITVIRFCSATLSPSPI